MSAARKIDFNPKGISEDIENHYEIMQGSIHHENIKILSMYAFKII
jgi:hypothetical protein